MKALQQYRRKKSDLASAQVTTPSPFGGARSSITLQAWKLSGEFACDGDQARLALSWHVSQLPTGDCGSRCP